MANPEHLAIIQAGANSWNEWRSQNREIQIDLSGAMLSKADLVRVDLADADLAGAMLAEANLLGANLERARLSYADLQGADLSYAVVRYANLEHANLGGVSFSGSNLNHANLYGADLSVAYLFRANLGRADLRNADLSRTTLIAVELSAAMLTGANLGSTVVADMDLSATTGLSSVRHHRPSSIGIDTISRSKGEIPDSFLIGAGVPDTFIRYAKSLVGSAIDFYSCFISYSTLDQEFANRLYTDLQAKGVRCWFAPHNVQGGRKLHEQIDEAIRLHDKLLLILSSHSMASEWVMTEISKARKREVRDGARVLFPISLAPFEAIRDWECFDSDTGKDSAREIREYFIPDFSNWKDDSSYQKAFERLLKDLAAGARSNDH